MEGVIFDIKRFAVHDGPGIRTTVFLKGCPLRCTWCHNPESQVFGIETRQGVKGPVSVGRVISVDQLMAELERDTAFYDESGGGVTFSGGEPLAQPAFLSAVLDRCGELDIHRAVDTCGEGPLQTVLNVASRTDLFLFDLKLIDRARHEQHTARGTDLIHSNLRALCDADVAIELRVPVVPGINDDRDSVDALGEFIAGLPRRLPVRLLPYHSAAMDKYPRFGMTVPLPNTPEPSDREMAALRERLEKMDLEVRK